RVVKNGWGIRRLDLRRRKLEDHFINVVMHEGPFWDDESNGGMRGNRGASQHVTAAREPAGRIRPGLEGLRIMPSKSITEKTDTGVRSSDWTPEREMAPSVLREDQLSVARVLGLVGLMLTIIGSAVLVTIVVGFASRVPGSLGALFFVIGLAFMLFHAARDSDMQIRRAYGVLGFLCVLTAIGVLLAALARGAGGGREPWSG